VTAANVARFSGNFSTTFVGVNTRENWACFQPSYNLEKWAGVYQMIFIKTRAIVMRDNEREGVVAMLASCVAVVVETLFALYLMIGSIQSLDRPLQELGG
jgi:hypothetical protein